ncbi:hypothetical protein SAMN04487906_0533 [Zhouia amylolytica]|uniref:Mis12-Mtw1 protein family n=2 Tax=Zhouia amylolytica TaxID=376730 RepID=W2UQ25_9FLAO|nr:hypothetical protein [Zhouia amylolytica]ETN96103.1 hypothetical protein P278_18250 [Zhouia amylolytica AD3]MCQ0112989.1 hypothetical protein [Zhouia amylolytica]SFS49293.1 hypothetical protein SAMN04487906_0533 [Zhouia amylolytica]
MSELIEIVDSLENKVSKLLHKMDVLKQENQSLKEELAIAEKSKHSLQRTIIEWEEKYNSLKVASSMLGSNEHKTETKLKINTLIREIDHCIAQLSE